MGYFSAVRRGHWEDYGGSFLAILMICIPGFVIAPSLIVLLGIKWRLFPVALWASPLHTILPVIALGLYFSGRIARLLRRTDLADKAVVILVQDLARVLELIASPERGHC